MPTAWVTTGISLQLIEPLRAAGWEIKTFASLGDAAASRLRDPDLMIFDLGDQPPSETFQQICQVKISPLLVFVANWDLAWQAIEAGADDAMVSPIDSAEVLFHAQRLVYRSKIVRVDELTIDLIAHRVKVGKRVIRLSPVEFRLLACLAQHIGEVVAINQILDEVWGSDPDRGGTMEQVTSAMKHLRRKIEPDPSQPQFIITVRSVGYRLRSQMQWDENL